MMIKTTPKLLPTLGLILCAVANSYGLTVITNDGFTQSNQPLPNTVGGVSSYGSNASVLNTSSNWTISTGMDGVTGTPDIALTWDTGQFDTYTNWNGRGNVVQLDSFNKPSHVFNITFTPAASVAVNVGSFDLDAWAGAPGSDIIVNWSLTNFDGSAIYSSGSFTELAASGGRSTITPGYTGAAGESLVLRLDQVQGDGSYLALDNLAFDQIVAVPEPTTTAFFVVGFLVFAGVSTRRLRASRRAEV